MFTFLHAIVLGLVEGVTEFLPISSTGHMILAANLMHISETDFVKSFEIIIQLGAILAVLALFWKKLLTNAKIFLRVAVAFIPTAIIGLLLYKVVKHYLLGSVSVVVWSLLIGGIALIIFEKLHKDKIGSDDTTLELESITYKQALVIGLCQSVAIIPGVSRSAATIVGGLLLGISRAAIVEFSFMLAVPTMAAATLLDLIKGGFSFSGSEMSMLLVGMIVAFVSAILAIKFLIRFVKNNSFTRFGIYRIAIAFVFLFVI